MALIDVREENELWGKQYVRKLNDILALQDEIAKDIAANLRLRLTSEEQQRLTKRYTENVEASQGRREQVLIWVLATSTMTQQT